MIIKIPTKYKLGLIHEYFDEKVHGDLDQYCKIDIVNKCLWVTNTFVLLRLPIVREEWTVEEIHHFPDTFLLKTDDLVNLIEFWQEDFATITFDKESNRFYVGNKNTESMLTAELQDHTYPNMEPLFKEPLSQKFLRVINLKKVYQALNKPSRMVIEFCKSKGIRILANNHQALIREAK